MHHELADEFDDTDNATACSLHESSSSAAFIACFMEMPPPCLSQPCPTLFHVPPRAATARSSPKSSDRFGVGLDRFRAALTAIRGGAGRSVTSAFLIWSERLDLLGAL